MFERLCRILSDYTETAPEDITESSDFLSDLDMNSLDIMEAVVQFEEEFGVSISDRAILGFRTVGDIIKFLEEN